MEKIKVTFEGKDFEVNPLSTTLEIIKELNLKVKDPVAVVINGYLTRLDKRLRVDSVLNIIELQSSQGKRIYESSLMLLFLSAFSKKYPQQKVFIQHSIHMGVYVEISKLNLSNDDIKEVESIMRKMVKDDLPINRIKQDWDVAMKDMKDSDRKDRENLYKYQIPSQYKQYELDGFKESLYLPLVPRTGTLKYFAIKKYREGLILVFPEFSKSYEVPEFVDQPKLFKSYQEYNEWTRLLGIRTVGQLNTSILKDKVGDLIKVAEALHEKRASEIADKITKKEHVPRLVLIAGPSSSGKTTFSKRLSIQLKVNGFRPIAISMDNYFVDREETPKDEFGNYDFEALEAIDVKLFMEQMHALLNGEEIELPKFDFKEGKKHPSGIKVKLEKDQIVIIEGIHGLNPKLTETIDSKDKYKIYISALTQLSLHKHDRILASDTRLIRRMIRDYYFRGYSASETLGRWDSVRAGEKKNIFPLQEEADSFFNSFLFYELSVLKVHAERMLIRVEKNDPMYPQAQRLLKFLSYFLPLDTKEIPPTSILKEFIGGSSFKY